RRSTRLRSAPGLHVEMANVHFRYTPALTVSISGLQGSLLATPGHQVVSFNHPESFSIAIDAAEIRMAPQQISALMNDWLLRSPKAQLQNVRIAIEGQRLRIRGTMKKGLHIDFNALADPGIT